MKAIFGDTTDGDSHWNVVQNNGMLASTSKDKIKVGGKGDIADCVIQASEQHKWSPMFISISFPDHHLIGPCRRVISCLVAAKEMSLMRRRERR